MVDPAESVACRQCGACCRWPGSVLLTPADLDRAAAWLGVATRDFIDRHTALARNRAQLTLTEGPDGSCGWLGEDGRCRLYPARPDQCREFPARWHVSGCPLDTKPLPDLSIPAGRCIHPE